MHSSSSYQINKLIDKLIIILEPIYIWIENSYIKELEIKQNKSEIELSRL